MCISFHYITLSPVTVKQHSCLIYRVNSGHCVLSQCGPRGWTPCIFRQTPSSDRPALLVPPALEVEEGEFQTNDSKLSDQRWRASR